MPAAFVSQPTRHLLLLPASSTGVTSLLPCCGLPSTSTFLRCGRCLIAPPRWHHMMFVGDYAPPLSGLIKQLKFGGAPNWPPYWLVYYYYDGYDTGGRPNAVIVIRSSSHNGSSVCPASLALLAARIQPNGSTGSSTGTLAWLRLHPTDATAYTRNATATATDGGTAAKERARNLSLR